MTFEINSTNVFVSEKDNIPTIHFQDELLKFNCSFRIDKIEYVNSFEGEKELTDPDDAKYIYSALKEKSSEFPFSVYELARRMWNLNHPNCRVKKMKMPDYRKLVKK